MENQPPTTEPQEGRKYGKFTDEELEAMSDEDLAKLVAASKTKPVPEGVRPRGEERESEERYHATKGGLAQKRAIQQAKIIRERRFRKSGQLISHQAAAKAAGYEGPMSLRVHVRRATPKKVGSFVGNLIRDTASFYDEWMVDRLARMGGDMAEKTASDFRKIIDREKQLYGEIAPLIDKARSLAGGNKTRTIPGTKIKVQTPGVSNIAATARLNGLTKVKSAPFGATANTVEAIETGIIKGAPMSDALFEMIQTARAINLAVGKMAETAVPLRDERKRKMTNADLRRYQKRFKARGLFQRNMTAEGFDVTRQGRGKGWERWTYALAKANNMSVGQVREIFRKFKLKLDKPGIDSADIERLNQDFKRKLPKVVTHVYYGGAWHEMIHSDLFNYLENTARRVTHMKAFRETFPATEDGKSKLAEARAAVANEMGGDGLDTFDAMVRTMQGVPTDNYTNWGLLSPSRLPGQMFRMVNNTLGNLMAKMALTSQMAVQPGELIAGSTPVFLGYKNYLRAVARVKQLYPLLEQMGAVNRVIHDFSWNPNAKIRSSTRMAGNAIGKLFGIQALNEAQEAMAAATAYVTAERIRNKTLSSWEKTMLPESFKAMGFNHEETMGLMSGDQVLLEQFIRKASAFLTSGNRAISEGSKLGANRLFNSIFRFQSYPMMKMNQFRRVTARLVEASTSGNPQEKKAAGIQFATFLFGNAAQGVLTTVIASAAFGGLSGLKIKLKEAKDEPGKFLFEAFMATVSGPLYMMMRGLKSKGVQGVGEAAMRTIFPYSVVRELTDMAQGAGKYRDSSWFDRIGRYLKARTPGMKFVDQALAITGLSQDDKDLDVAIDGFLRWRRDAQGFMERQDFTNEDVRKGFRTEMKKVVEAIKRQDAEGFSDHFIAAQQKLVEEGIEGDVGTSLKRAKILKNYKGGDLTEEEMAALRQRIGDDAVDRLEYFDDMLDAAGSGTLLPKYQ